MLALVAVAALLEPGPRPAAGEPTTAAFKLNAGQKVFWDGEDVDSAHVPDPKLCGIAGPCWEYKIDVAENSWRLRVALSTKLRNSGDVRSWPDFASASEMIFDLEVWGPGSSEKPAATGSTETVITGYDVEVFVPNPVAAIYTVRVIPRSVTDMSFRMRAKLEKERPPDPTVQLLSPNLRVIPPFEFSFYDPTVNYGPGGGDPAPGASCMEGENEEAGSNPPTLCLRYSMGLENAGEGRWDLAVIGGSCLQPDDLTACHVQQRRWRSDGTSQLEDGSERTAFHATHAHFHYHNAWKFELFRVQDGWKAGDSKPTLEGPYGTPQKLGLEPTNERMAEWKRFSPACGTHASPLDSDEEKAHKIKFCQHDQHVRGDGAFELQAGWGDIYEWNRSGNYVDFPQAATGVPRAGFYVLRGEADPHRTVIESDISDNASYALVRVSARGLVQLIERGYGTDPWDPAKSVLATSP